MQADSVVSDLLTSDFSSSTRGERHNPYYANHPQRAVHLVMFKISVDRDPKKTQLHLQRPKSNAMPQWEKLSSLPP